MSFEFEVIARDEAEDICGAQGYDWGPVEHSPVAEYLTMNPQSLAPSWNNLG